MCCSTPFGVTDGFTVSSVVVAEVARICSTPFGVTDGFTATASRVRLRTTAAQRLSASLVWLHTHRRAQGVARFSSSCAQRLSASLVWLHTSISGRIENSRIPIRYPAQRLSASLVWLHMRTGHAIDVIVGREAAQRLSASLVWLHLWQVRWRPFCRTLRCSTPFGVTGLASLRCRRLHQLAASSGCSTPFGVTGLASLWPSTLARWCRCPAISAQRLSASLMASPPARSRP